VLSAIQKICVQTGAKHVVFYLDTVSSFDFLEKTGLNVLLENRDIRKDRFQKWSEFAPILKEHSFCMCLDLAHALSANHDTLSEFLKNPEKIRQVHTSFLKDLKHTPIHLAGKAIIDEVKRIKVY